MCRRDTVHVRRWVGCDKLLACEIFTHYGTVKIGLGGEVNCAVLQVAHLREADLLVEIIDPQTAKALAEGQWGKIIHIHLLITLATTARCSAG